MNKKVVWSNQAIDELESILWYWKERNKSDDYAYKIIKATDKIVKLIISNPEIGIPTKFKSVKMKLIMDRFYLFYRDEHDIL